MCGISGIFMRGGHPVDPERLDRLASALAHRGPDADGRFLSGPIGFAHTRLSIVDLATGDQPLFGAQGAVLIANGEIYNAPELRPALQDRLKTLSDCEPAAHIFETDGAAFAEKLRGMYAIAIWSPADETLTLSRDPFGIKPLYYVETEEGLAFASEIGALVAAGFASPMPSERARNELLQLKYTLGSETIIPGVYRVAPGETLTLRDGRIVSRRRIAAFPAKAAKGAGSELADPVAAFEAVMTESVSAHLIADVPVSLFLSGGVDSSILLILMRRLMQEVIAITVGYEDASLDRSVDESEAALRHAARHGVEAERITMTRDDFFALAPRIAYALDDPTADAAALPSYMLARAARARGLKVALCGEGADELFGGYRRYRTKLIDRLIPRQKVKRGTFSKTGLESRLGTAWRDHYDAEARSAGSGQRSRTLALQAADIANWLPNDLLIKLDRTLMANAIEGRTPYLDPKVAAFASALPDRLRVADGVGKVVMRQWLARADPAYPAFAKKKGFITPVGRWITSRASDLAPLLARQSCFAELVNARSAADILERAERDAQPAWSLLFYALWSATRVLGLDPKGDLISVLQDGAR